MPIFAIALVPEGNILRQVRQITSLAFSSGDRPAARALPEGIYLGFYADRIARDKDLLRGFRRGAETLFAGLPPVLVFSSAARRGGKWYMVPDLEIPRGVSAAADAIALEAGFLPLESPPLLPGTGFFAGNDVTVPLFGAFSFRHLDAILYLLESEDPDFGSVRWTVLSRIARRTGPRNAGPA